MPPLPRFLCLIFLLAALSGCTPRADITPRSAPAVVGQSVDVLVGTTRARVDGGLYDPQARGALSFAAMDIAIPPAHRIGYVEVGGTDPDPQKHFLTRSIQPLQASEYRREISRRLSATPRYQDDVFIFIHGYNNTMADGVFRTAQMYSDMGLHALPVHYSWPSNGTVAGYPYDRESAIYARNGLQELIEQTAAAGARHILLVAHSLGSQVTMETLRQMSLSGRGTAWDKIGGVILMAPDLNIDLFHEQAADIGTLPQPFLIFSSQRDRALQLSARFTGEANRLGNIQSLEPIGDLKVTVIDVTEFRDTWNVHMTVVSSPALIQMIEAAPAIEPGFRASALVQDGILPGTIRQFQSATEVALVPADTTTQ